MTPWNALLLSLWTAKIGLSSHLQQSEHCIGVEDEISACFCRTVICLLASKLMVSVLAVNNRLAVQGLCGNDRQLQ